VSSPIPDTGCSVHPPYNQPASLCFALLVAKELASQLHAPLDADLYKTETEKEQARQKMFDSMDLKNTGVVTFDEWYKFSMEHIIAKTATLAPHPILDTSNKEEYMMFLKKATTSCTEENTELYWFLVELFTEHDGDKDGIVLLNDYPAMLDLVLETPKKLGLTHSEKGLFEEDSVKRKEAFDVMFKTYNPRGDDRMCLDEWVKLAMEGIFKKFIA